jgi:hypothetical protein
LISQWAPHGFTWRKVVSIAVGISTFESTVIYPFNRNIIPEFLFSIYDTSEPITGIETALPNNALVFVPSISVPIPQNVLPISAEPSLRTKVLYFLLTLLLKKLLPPDFCRRSVYYRKYLENTELKNCNTITEEPNNIEEKLKKQKGSKVKEQRRRKCKQS